MPVSIVAALPRRSSCPPLRIWTIFNHNRQPTLVPTPKEARLTQSGFGVGFFLRVFSPSSLLRVRPFRVRGPDPAKSPHSAKKIKKIIYLAAPSGIIESWEPRQRQRTASRPHYVPKSRQVKKQPLHLVETRKSFNFALPSATDSSAPQSKT